MTSDDHQQGLPIKARPDTTMYRVSGFVRRNRLAILSAILGTRRAN